MIVFLDCVKGVFAESKTDPGNFDFKLTRTSNFLKLIPGQRDAVWQPSKFVRWNLTCEGRNAEISGFAVDPKDKFWIRNRLESGGTTL